MPIGRFVAATLLMLDEQLLKGEIWVGGTPEVFLLNQSGRVEQTFKSSGLPLGIIDNRSFDGTPKEFIWTHESQMILFSDGLIEATNPDGQQFTVDGLLNATRDTTPDQRFACIEAALENHLSGQIAADDISLMIVDCP